MTKLPFGPPQRVSPLIRGARYAFLIAGILYGRIKQKIYQRRERAFQEEEAKKKIKRDKEMEIKRKKILAEERANIKLLESGELFD